MTRESHEAGTGPNKVAWEEWRYRHDLFHRLLFRYTAAVGTVCLIPQVRATNLSAHSTSAFETLALLLGIFGLVHLVLEFTRVVHLRTMVRIFSDHSWAEFKRKHKVYARLSALPFDYVMWFLLAVFLLGLPAYLKWGGPDT